MQGKIIVIEGVDSVGKNTQANILKERLSNAGYKVFLHSFPSYAENQSMLVRMYLGGQFGENVDCVNYKVASSFFAVDRIATYHLLLKKKLEEGYILILDRYTTSNMVHQAGKFNLKRDILKAAKWIDNFEFNDLGLPRPNTVIYLTIDQKVREILLDNRRSNEEKDIYEKDKEYLKRANKAGLMVADYFNWKVVVCSVNESMRSIDSISTEIYNIVATKL